MASVSQASIDVLRQLGVFVREGDIAEFLAEATQSELADFFKAQEVDIRTIAGMCRILTRAVDENDEQL